MIEIIGYLLYTASVFIAGYYTRLLCEDRKISIGHCDLPPGHIGYHISWPKCGTTAASLEVVLPKPEDVAIPQPSASAWVKVPPASRVGFDAAVYIEGPSPKESAPAGLVLPKPVAMPSPPTCGHSNGISN